MNNSPIFALSTANLTSALHLHRISGQGVFQIFSPHVMLGRGLKKLNLESLALSQSHKPVTRYVTLYDTHGDMIDDVIMTLYPNPWSFTGEDLIEFSLHGNPLISLKLHSLCRKLGLRDARPGEFTQRAVLHGKLDLAQAEGINQLIHAESMGAIELARNNLEGVLSSETLAIRTQIIALLAYLEAHIDFAPDEVGDYNPQELLPKIDEIQNKLTSLFASYENGLKIRSGLKIVLCGKPNAGKSSLYNSFLKDERAIVTNIPGTTRDVLEDRLYIDNKEFVLLDTAGLRETSDEVEKIGVSRSLKSITQANIVCYLMDSTQYSNENYLTEIQQEIVSFINDAALTPTQKLTVVLNKKDILSAQLKTKLEKITTLSFDNASIQSADVALVSQNDLNSLSENLLSCYKELIDKFNTKETPILISQRQKDKVSFALQEIREAKILIQAQDYPEKIASLFNSAKASLEEIIGDISVDNVFETVFSSFCIGK